MIDNRRAIALLPIMLYIGIMATQKGLKPENIFALTNETRTEFWVHVSLPGYEELKAHYTCTDPQEIDDEITKAFDEFVHIHKNAKFEVSIEDELNDPESEISKLLDEIRNTDNRSNANRPLWERTNTSDSWGSIADDVKANVGQKVNDLRETFGGTADKAKDVLKDRFRNFRKN